MKGVNFYGPRSEYIISGSDCSNVFLWEKQSEKIVQFFPADEGGVVSTHCYFQQMYIKIVLLSPNVLVKLVLGHMNSLNDWLQEYKFSLWS